MSKIIETLRNITVSYLIKISVVTLSVIAIPVIALCLVSPKYRFFVNHTESIPGVIYLVSVGDIPSKGDLAAFHSPDNRFYIKGHVFIKYIKGKEGDCVQDKDGFFTVAAEPAGFALEKDSQGRRMEPGPTGCIPAHKYFVWTPHQHSFDSRYSEIGWIDESSIIGRATRIL